MNNAVYLVAYLAVVRYPLQHYRFGKVDGIIHWPGFHLFKRIGGLVNTRHPALIIQPTQSQHRNPVTYKPYAIEVGRMPASNLCPVLKPITYQQLSGQLGHCVIIAYALNGTRLFNDRKLSSSECIKIDGHGLGALPCPFMGFYIRVSPDHTHFFGTGEYNLNVQIGLKLRRDRWAGE